MPAERLLHFIHTPLFDESADEVMSDDELRAAQKTLQDNPTAGDLVKGTSGARKLRVRVGGRGKSYGARVIYYYQSSDRTVYLLLAYSKTETDDLSSEGKKVLREIIQKL